ncbi:MAG: hypothetical protein SVR08_17045 [Spirochaetota bacterium]|nr:hypothetical protein [Spirochaetota bacterium]
MVYRHWFYSDNSLHGTCAVYKIILPWIIPLKFIYEDDSIDEITFGELKKYQVIRYDTQDGFYIDLMTKIGTAFSYEDISYEIIDYKEIKIKIATPETLFKLKKDTVREKDKWDARFFNDLIKNRLKQ